MKLHNDGKLHPLTKHFGRQGVPQKTFNAFRNFEAFFKLKGVSWSEKGSETLVQMSNATENWICADFTSSQLGERDVAQNKLAL